MPGVGVFRGDAGDNEEHYHYAHQLSVGVRGTVELESRGRRYANVGLFVTAGHPHRIQPGKIISIYFDPNSELARALYNRFRNTAPVFGLPSTMVDQLRQSFGGACTMRTGLKQFIDSLQLEPQPVVDQRLDLVLQRLEIQRTIARAELAALVGLSESRFSHWFREQAGMPLRSYRKWLRLIRGLEHVLAGMGLTDAAHSADFSDQAHFARTFKEMFGLRPSEALNRIQSETIGD